MKTTIFASLASAGVLAVMVFGQSGASPTITSSWVPTETVTIPLSLGEKRDEGHIQSAFPLVENLLVDRPNYAGIWIDSDYVNVALVGGYATLDDEDKRKLNEIKGVRVVDREHSVQKLNEVCKDITNSFQPDEIFGVTEDYTANGVTIRLNGVASEDDVQQRLSKIDRNKVKIKLEDMSGKPASIKVWTPVFCRNLERDVLYRDWTKKRRYE